MFAIDWWRRGDVLQVPVDRICLGALTLAAEQISAGLSGPEETN
jgi:hypothetical protein